MRPSANRTAVLRHWRAVRRVAEPGEVRRDGREVISGALHVQPLEPFRQPRRLIRPRTMSEERLRRARLILGLDDSANLLEQSAQVLVGVTHVIYWFVVSKGNRPFEEPANQPPRW